MSTTMDIKAPVSGDICLAKIGELFNGIMKMKLNVDEDFFLSLIATKHIELIDVELEQLPELISLLQKYDIKTVNITGLLEEDE